MKSSGRRARTKMKFSETQIEKIEELASRMTIDKVVEQFGVEEEIFCEVIRRQKPALRAYKKGRVIGVIRAGETLWRRMETGSIEAIIFFSKLHGVWSDKQKHEVNDKAPTSPTFRIVMNKNH